MYLICKSAAENWERNWGRSRFEGWQKRNLVDATSRIRDVWEVEQATKSPIYFQVKIYGKDATR